MMDKIALILVIVGALNWGGIGIFGFDTVAFLFGGQTAVLSRQCQLQLSRNRLRILKKHLVEITQPVKKDTVRILLFCLEIMCHHW